jgi:hypothetical protein
MEEIPYSRAYFESLTTEDLIKIADDLGVEIPHDLDRIHVIDELLEFFLGDAEEPNNSQKPEMKDSVQHESVPLPKNYNITFIEVMIRDPLWAFVFWEIKGSDKEQLEKAHDFNGYYLKLTPLDDPDNSFPRETEGVFTVPVRNEDTARYLGFTPPAVEKNSQAQQSKYKVEFCACVGEEEIVLAVSNTIKLPGLPELPNRAVKQEPELSENPLLSLSGYGDFRILCKNERQPRTKGGASAYPNE